MTLALRSRSGGLAALQLIRVPHHHLVERNAHGVAGVASQVLIGQEEDLLVAVANAQSQRALRAFDEVQTTPPRSPQKALIAAVEFM